MYALVDCNNFYASCERIFRPDLAQTPIVVLSNNDGCVIARSNEAKALGIPMGAPAFKFEDVFEKKGIKVFSSNYALYGDMSKRVMKLLSGFTPEIEVYSIDEAFLKFKGFDNYDIDKYGQKIRYAIAKGTGIPLSLGFAPTKALAKVANRVAKKFPERTQSVYVINSEESRIKALKWLKIEDVWGIGRQHCKRLQAKGVYNAYEFTLLPDQWVQKEMSIVGLRLKQELEGNTRLELEDVANKKNIATTRSFDRNYTEYNDLKERVVTFATSCAEKLRNQQSKCNAMLVFLMTNEHRKDLAQYSSNMVIQLPFSSNSNIDLAKQACIALSKIYRKGFQYKKAGVIVMDIVPDNPNQLTLFDKENPKHAALMRAIDLVNKKEGTQKLKLASQDLKQTWKMKQERLSPKYTTNFSDIPVIKA